jgi:hypothetical protein
MSRCKQILMAAVSLLVITPFAAPGLTQAATIDWIGGSSAAWTTAGNWTGATTPPTNDLTTDIARFNQTSYTNQPTAPANRNINGLIFGDGTTATAATTITTATGTSRLNVGAAASS